MNDKQHIEIDPDGGLSFFVPFYAIGSEIVNEARSNEAIQVFFGKFRQMVDIGLIGIDNYSAGMLVHVRSEDTFRAIESALASVRWDEDGATR